LYFIYVAPFVTFDPLLRNPGDGPVLSQTKLELNPRP